MNRKYMKVLHFQMLQEKINLFFFLDVPVCVCVCVCVYTVGQKSI